MRSAGTTRAWTVGVLLLTVLLPPGIAPAASGGLRQQIPSVLPRIVNGLETRHYPAVGILLAGDDTGSASLLCSGTLIGCETFLTAAHCVEGNSDPASYFVFFQHAGFFGVSSVTSRPDYDFPVGDVAVMRLSAPLNGIAPIPINTSASPGPGTAGVIVGFGRTGGPDYEYGLKRYGGVTTADCDGGISSVTSVCWNFESPLGPPGEDSNTCNGDSGGPLLVDFGSGDTVAGITSGGFSDDCLPTDVSYDANVFHYRTWIEGEGGADLSRTTCGEVPQVGDTGTGVLAFSGDLDSGVPDGVHSVEVPVGTTLLRFAMNATDNDTADFDLYVKAGSLASSTTFDCKADGPGQYGFCEFAAPAPGTWNVLVHRYRGTGRYQLTVTTFEVDCGNPANEGAACDDGNACTGPDTCGAGVCAGPSLLDGTSCDDGSACSRGDACEAGACVSGPAPALGCKTTSIAGRSFLRIKNKTPDKRDRIVWRWLGGSATAVAEFGDPAAGAGYVLCVYDDVGGVPHLEVEVPLPTGTRWTLQSDGFKYRDRSRKALAIRKVRLKAGLDGKASIFVTGKGEDLGLGPAVPLQQEGGIIVQLLNDDTCWEATYSTNIVNDGTTFRARGD